jgi:uncharacterized RDD family membrane protein YckC
MILPKGPFSAQAEASSRGKESPAVASVASATDFGFDFMDEETTPKVPQPSELKLPSPESLQPTGATETPFSWDEEDTEDALADEEPLDEEVANDDTLGLDLSWDSDFPALDEEEPGAGETEDLETEKFFGPGTGDELPDWEFDEEPPEEGPKAQQKKGPEGEPRDPFELRGPGTEAPVPALAEAAGAIRTDLSCERVNDTETEHLTGSAPTVVPFTANVVQSDGADEDFLTAFEATPQVTPTTSPAWPSPLIRILAMGIDLLILFVVILLFLLAGEAALAPAGARHLLPTPETLLNLAIPYFLILFSVFFGYFTLFHFLTGQTPGKMLLRLRVEAESGAPLAFSQAFLRSTGGLFSLLLLGLGFLAIFLDDRRRGWNDRLAGTLVVTAVTKLQAPDEEADDLR